jgi:hypothetical protein
MAQPDGVAALSSDEVALVLAHLAGNVRALCAAACVSRAWREAAARPALWVHLRRVPTRVAERLDAERLTSLVARAAGGLERLDVFGAVNLSDADLEGALQQPHALTRFVAENSSLTGIAAALASRRGLILQLGVVGLSAGPLTRWFDRRREQEYHYGWRDTEEQRERDTEAFNIACGEVLNALSALMAPGAELDGEQTCEGHNEPDARGLCNIICGSDNSCGKCRRAICRYHEHGQFFACLRCATPFCGYSAYCRFQDEFCGECKATIDAEYAAENASGSDG